MTEDTLLIFCTCPDRSSADKIATSLVERGLAACVNLTPPVTSIYTWQGKVETAEEIQLIIKSSRSAYSRLEQCVLSLHPYELPEIIAVPIERGLTGYLNWVEQCTKSND
jgi:periplasmic divalent cation tolerance protein